MKPSVNWLLALIPATLALVLIGAHVAGNGRANWYKGVQLVTVYLIIALMFYLLPTAS